MINPTMNDEGVFSLIHMWCNMTIAILEKLCIKCDRCPLNATSLNHP